MEENIIMAETISKTHPTNSDGDPVSLFAWGQANYTGDDAAAWTAAWNTFKAQVDEGNAPTLSESGYTVVYDDTQAAFWSANADRVAAWDGLRTYWEAYRADASLTWA